MTEAQKEDVKEMARKLYEEKRISLGMALWAMKNAGYTREETAQWMEQVSEGIVSKSPQER
jgi:hypothetical protein